MKVLPRADRRKTVLIALLLVSIYAVLALSTLRDTGVTWDETFYMSQSKARAYSLYSMATGKPDLPFCDLTESFFGTEWQTRCWEGRARTHSTFSGLVWAATWYLNGQSLDVLSSIAAHRLATVILTAFGLLVMFIFVSESLGRRAALFSTLALMFMPRFFSHSKYLLFDEPSAIFWILTLFVFWKGLSNWKWGLLGGVVYGLALTTKAQTVFIPAVLALWLLISYRDRIPGLARQLIRKPAGFLTRRRMVVFYSFAFVTPVIFMAAWPWLWYDTLNRIFWWIGYYGEMMGEQAVPQPYFLGHVLLRAPVYLPFIMAAATTPLAILAFSLAGAFKAVRSAIDLKNRILPLILISAVVPILVLGVIGVLYNGVQEFLPALPFVAILAGVGADWFLSTAPKFSAARHLRKLGNPVTVLTVLLILCFSLPGLIAIAKGHTDAYYSELVGGPSGVYQTKLLETAWSGEAYLQAARWLSDNAAPNSTVYVPMAYNIFNTYKYGDIGQISTRMDVSSLEGFSFEQQTIIRDDISIMETKDPIRDPSLLADVDYVVLLSRSSLSESDTYLIPFSRNCMENAAPVYTVALDGAPLVNVYKTPC